MWPSFDKWQWLPYRLSFLALWIWNIHILSVSYTVIKRYYSPSEQDSGTSNSLSYMVWRNLFRIYRNRTTSFHCEVDKTGCVLLLLITYVWVSTYKKHKLRCCYTILFVIVIHKSQMATEVIPSLFWLGYIHLYY